MKRIFLKPKADTIIRFPISGELLPAEGKEVILNAYWRRRLMSEDVVAVGQIQSLENAEAKIKTRKKRG